MKRLTRGARELTGEDYDRLRLTPGEKVEIRLCPALPTSFVVRGGKGHVIYLQQELPPERMKLVLLHEREHVRQHHPWLQGIATAAWAFSFWSPLIWAGYYLFRRDMELSCDQGVLDRLDREERREYARTLVELASNRPVWGGLTTFGECDAALRVKKAAGWRPIIQDGRWFLGWLAAAVLALFLVAGAPADRVLGADILAEMDRMDIWEEADQAADWGPDTVFYADGSHGFADVYFQDLEGNWWHILYRRVPDARHGREVYVDQLPNSPSLRGYQVLDTERNKNRHAPHAFPRGVRIFYAFCPACSSFRRTRCSTMVRSKDRQAPKGSMTKPPPGRPAGSSRRSRQRTAPGSAGSWAAQLPQLGPAGKGGEVGLSLPIRISITGWRCPLPVQPDLPLPTPGTGRFPPGPEGGPLRSPDPAPPPGSPGCFPGPSAPPLRAGPGCQAPSCAP